MFSLECPVCRHSFSRLRSFTRTAWSRWSCPTCQSVLGISMKRRLIATIPWIGMLLFYFLYMDLMSWGLWIALPIVCGTGLAIYMTFERLVVHERCGFRCRECGYDLQGQQSPQCPECGTVLSEEDTRRMRLLGEAAASPPVAAGRFGRWAAVFVIVLLSLFVAGQIVFLCVQRPGAPDPRFEIRRVLDGILQYAQANAGQPPAHALQIGVNELLFVACDSDTTMEDVPVPGGNLGELSVLDPLEKIPTSRDAAAALPPRTIAHRMGDYVFTYHGLDLQSPDPDLWLVIRSYDPDCNAPATSTDTLIVGQADGRVVIIKGADFPNALARQNALRASLGLAPLPDPATVTHDAPAVAPP